ncbi:MAG: hydrogenobyrinic acid a,c-diamide synthase (glutamine-hydrolyzing) [Chromatiales bacterium]|nr:hydrogenobyrinic acid a,c-diamide synthase (glutamine-hydrolyzing) [Chromatiales bacterium]
MAYLYISAAHKSSGKTTLSIGLCAALHQRGLKVQPFKKGPDFIDPLWLGRAAGRPCYNLDPFLSDFSTIESEFHRRMQTADVGLLEGNKGLFDGLDLDGGNSNAAVAQALGAPVVLVLDARGMTRGIAPLILGYQHFEPKVRIAGVILNQLGGSRHEAKLRSVIEHYTEMPVLGAVHRFDELAIDERHLGLIPSNEAQAADHRIATIAARVAESVELDRVMDVAGLAPSVPKLGAVEALSMGATRIRIGIAKDKAFGFYYPGDLESLEQAGAEIVVVNTLTDARLPPLDGLFLGGGFPETCMAELEANQSLRGEIATAIEDGLPVYAECGGLMYLGRSISWKGQTRQMVGALPVDAVMHARPQGRGYVRLEETSDHPWGGAPAVGEVRAHEFHYSRLENIAPGLRYAYRVKRGAGIDGENDGLVYRKVLAGYTHLRSVPGQAWATRFVDYLRRCRRPTE